VHFCFCPNIHLCMATWCWCFCLILEHAQWSDFLLDRVECFIDHGKYSRWIRRWFLKTETNRVQCFFLIFYVVWASNLLFCVSLWVSSWWCNGGVIQCSLFFLLCTRDKNMFTVFITYLIYVYILFPELFVCIHEFTKWTVDMIFLTT